MPRPPRCALSSPSEASRRAARAALVLLLALGVLLGQGGTARAADGRLGYEERHQDGGTAGVDYQLQIITRGAQAQQSMPLWGPLSLRVEAQVQDEETQSRVGDVSSAWDRLTQRGIASLRFGGSWLRADLHASGRRREESLHPQPLLTSDAGELGGWANLRPASWLTFQGSWLDSRNWNERSEGPEVETHESLRSAGAETALGPVGTLRYAYARNATENLTRSSLGVNSSHLLAYEGVYGLQGSRGRLSVSARTRRFNQHTRQDPYDGRLLLEPLVVGVRIDDSPEIEDPLEDPLTSVPGLSDLDRRAGTSVDLGDDAPVGLQIGGDYRNLQMDFGRPFPLSEAVLYVDRRPLAPELLQWRVYIADDPQGQLWEELTGVTAVYRDLDSGLQGWEFSIEPPMATRYVKFVDVKLGPVGAVLRVTELEVYTPDSTPGRETRDQADSQRLFTALDYGLTRNLSARVDVTLRHRGDHGDTPDLDDRAQGAGLSYTRGAWSASARAELHRVESGGRLDSDVTTAAFGLRRRLGDASRAGVHYDRVDDRGDGGDRRTRALSVNADLRLAPALRVSQRFSYGWLDDRTAALSSRSFTSQSVLRSVPARWLYVDLTRTDRWVRREAGAGFTPFNDSSLSLGLTPVPLVSLRSTVTYQVRDKGEWLVRHTLTWSPLPGGDLAVHLNANQFSDTRVDTRQAGAGASVTWEPRPRLLLEGGVDAQRTRRAQGSSSPLNTFVKGSLVF